MQTSKLITVELPNGHLVVRIAGGRRVGTIFSTDQGWCYQFDGTAQEGPLCRDPSEALGIMEAVAQHEQMLEPVLQLAETD
jgi:hypothetical protein